MKTFESTTYEYRQGYLIRTVDTVAEFESYPDGSFRPQRTISTRESEVVPTDRDFEEAVQFAEEVAAENYLASFE